ncbi:hypothetical protein ACGFIW_01955 [Micromonospora sp. NPDC048935]|uniref:hypothetical protein n=1 Tax=Micromonospora sp. NPDC048935 TaxID=3364262 RepID=UPI0037203137
MPDGGERLMGREIKRVPLDFDAPIGEVWTGYVMPDDLRGEQCGTCDGGGYSQAAKHLHKMWYGNAPFRPEDNGSTPLTPETPAVRAFAERNVTRSPDYYGQGEHVIRREARRLADYWNSAWSHHVNEADVAALVEAGRLYDLTHTWTRENGWQPIDPPVMPTPEQVNQWNIASMGHDAINASVVVRARCERDGVDVLCSACGGEGIRWRNDQHKAAHEAWERTEPPSGDGWQLWETVSEGSPKSPVFATADELASWMSDPERGRDWVPGDVAAKFIADGWAPTLVGSSGDLMSGVEFVGTRGGDA